MSLSPAVSEPQTIHRWRSILGSIFFVLIGSLCGFLMGAVYAKLIMHHAGMGWDRLADTLGALMIGTGSGFTLSILAILWFASARRTIMYVMIGFGMLLFVLLYRGQVQKLEAVPPVSTEPQQPVSLSADNLTE